MIRDQLLQIIPVFIYILQYFDTALIKLQEVKIMFYKQ